MRLVGAETGDCGNERSLWYDDVAVMSHFVVSAECDGLRDVCRDHDEARGWETGEVAGDRVQSRVAAGQEAGSGAALQTRDGVRSVMLACPSCESVESSPDHPMMPASLSGL